MTTAVLGDPPLCAATRRVPYPLAHTADGPRAHVRTSTTRARVAGAPSTQHADSEYTDSAAPTGFANFANFDAQFGAGTAAGVEGDQKVRPGDKPTRICSRRPGS